MLHGWVVGDLGFTLGIIWRTTDGGLTWEEQVQQYPHEYYGTATQSIFRNSTVGAIYSGVDTALVKRTTNAGISWQDQAFDAKSTFRKIIFIDSLHGWITATLDQGNNGAVYHTTNGGVSWQQTRVPYPLEAISFVDTLHGWACVVGSAYFYHTINGGATWDSLSVVSVSPSVGFDALSFVDTLNGWAFGNTFYQGIISEVIYKTTDGGQSWSQESIGLTDDLGDLFDAKMLDRTHGWAVAGDGRVLSYGIKTGVIEKLPGLPDRFSLHQNFPNPFNSTTTIDYELLSQESVELKVYDDLGKEVRTLVSERQEPGVYRVRFDASSLASGTYWYMLKTLEGREVRQMILLK